MEININFYKDRKLISREKGIFLLILPFVNFNGPIFCTRDRSTHFKVTISTINEIG